MATIREMAAQYEHQLSETADARDTTRHLIWAYEGVFQDARKTALEAFDRVDARRREHKKLQRKVWKLAVLTVVFGALAWLSRRNGHAKEEAEAA